MESISQIRQMMAEQKFFEVQRLIEVQLTLQSENRFEWLKLYSESLKAQQKGLPAILAIELAEFESQNKNHEIVLGLIGQLTEVEVNNKFIQIKKMIIQALEDKGQMDKLYFEISNFLIHQFENQNPSVPSWMTAIIEKYFKHDFSLKLKELALALMVNDLGKSVTITKELIYSCMEKSSPKGISSKYLAIGEVLKSGASIGALEIYRSFCLISGRGLDDKSDYKRLVEIVIYFEEFKLQVLVLNLMHRLGLSEEATLYSSVVRSNLQYNFVYFDKYFSHLKGYFIQQNSHLLKEEAVKPVIQTEAAAVSKFQEEVMSPGLDVESSEDQDRFLQILKYQEYSNDQLCDLAVSFLQSEMPRVAIKAAELAIANSKDAESFLKGSYLRLTGLLQIKDYRAALDTCLMALAKATTKNDVLSFMYGQAEVLIRLNEFDEARQVLSRILSIDSKYRLAKERLDKL
ncbi:MAG: hypothetical protein NDI69_06050 [Bacteriovoracaceae bacterium]|nr:hypothetical protein [Bacteriovoracaceae bacterium]